MRSDEAGAKSFQGNPRCAERKCLEKWTVTLEAFRGSDFDTGNIHSSLKVAMI